MQLLFNFYFFRLPCLIVEIAEGLALSFYCQFSHAFGQLILEIFVCASPLLSNSHVTQFLAVSILKHSRTPSNALGMMDYQNNDHEQLVKRLRSAQSVDEVHRQ